MLMLVCVVYVVIGLIVAVEETRRCKDVDMADMAWLPFLVWPFFVFAWVIEAIVRFSRGKR